MIRISSLSLVLIFVAAQAVIAEQDGDPQADLGAPIAHVRSQELQTELEQALQEVQVDKRLELLWKLGSRLSASDFPGVLEIACDLKELRERMVFQEAALVRWGELAPAEAFAYVAKLPESQSKVNIIREMAMNFARKDPPRAAAAAASMIPGASRNDVIETIANVWAQSDASGAHEWARTLPDDFAKEQALNAVRYVWVHTDPIAAARIVERLPANQTTTNLISNVAYEWALRDPQAAIQWANRLPDGPDKDEAHVKIAESWANDDPKAAAAFALKLPRGEARFAASAMVASRWAKQDPITALGWSWRQEDIELRARCVGAALEVWAPTDPARAGHWLGNLPPGPERDQAILAYVEYAVMWAPDLVADRALMIGNTQARARALNQCLSRWREVDPVATEQWLHEARLASGQ